MAGPYEVRVAPAAGRQLKKLDRVAQQRILLAMRMLATTPRPRGAKALKGRPGYLRVRIGEYRVIYTVDDGVLLVLVVRVGHRKDVYL